MLYLTTPPTDDRIAMYQHHNIGVMNTPHMGNRYDQRWPYMACDNGCFAETTSGRPFDLGRYLGWLDQQPRTALFATAPDVVGDWAATVARSTPVLPTLRQLGFKAAVVLQNGVTADGVDWDACDAVFVGGDDAFKYSTVVAHLVGEAGRRGKWAHVGRVNSFKRLQWAHLIGADSCDGTFVAFGPDINLSRAGGWLRRLASTPSLNLAWRTA